MRRKPDAMLKRLPHDEEQLVRMAAACDDAAFCAVRDRYLLQIQRVASRFAARTDDRDDLQADIIAGLLHDRKHALREWQPVAPFAAYLTTIATRHCMLWARREGRLHEARLTALPDYKDEATTDAMERLIPADPDDDPDMLLERRETFTALSRALSEMSDADRLLLVMRFQDGMDGPAMARALGVSHGAVRQRLFKALRRLESMLVAEAPELFEGCE
ncbi:MAG TPA: sigma-70 family RNA polymerase sigma factor [Armatimonadota bacterium]|nr:sigma-70 family RNA polymerase sigma factor [Armatimonadota bacterium]